jgi:hypothetical protein
MLTTNYILSAAKSTKKGDCANDTGDDSSNLAVLADILSKQDSFGRIWLWMVPGIMNLTAPTR